MSNPEKADLFREEREKAILESVRATGRSTVSELARAFNVTDTTIRRDLAKLEAQGAIKRTHGGAVPLDLVSYEYPLAQRLSERQPEKTRIAEATAQLIGDARLVFLDEGTTTLSVARCLRDRRELTVVTSDPNIGLELARESQVEVILIGGTIRRSTMGLGGPLARLTLSQLRADYAILGMTALSARDGLFSVSPADAEIKNEMMRHAKQTIVVADSSKLGRLATSFVGPWSSIDYLVTDGGAPKDEIDALRFMGVKIAIAD